jgi:hypothetical protein
MTDLHPIADPLLGDKAAVSAPRRVDTEFVKKLSKIVEISLTWCAYNRITLSDRELPE